MKLNLHIRQTTSRKPGPDRWVLTWQQGGKDHIERGSYARLSPIKRRLVRPDSGASAVRLVVEGIRKG